MRDLRPVDPTPRLAVVDDRSFWDHLPESQGRVPGYVPRPPAARSSYAAPMPLTTIPRSEIASRAKDLREAGGTLLEARERGKDGGRIPSLDQGQRGYCWAHSTSACAILLRARDNQPFVDLSPYSVACPVKNFRDEGGYCLESLEQIARAGIASSAFWPQRSVDKSLTLNRAMWGNAAKHRFNQWYDLDPRDPMRRLDQILTCLLLRIPVAADFMWWGHSVCLLRIESFDPKDIIGGLSLLIWNSWGDSWGQNGLGIIRGRRAIPDEAVAPAVVMGSLD